MPLRLDSEQEREPVQEQLRQHPTTLFSSDRFDQAVGLIAGALPLTLFVVGQRRDSQLCSQVSPLVLLVLCLLYFLPLRFHRSLQRGLMVGMALYAGGLGLLCLVQCAARFAPALDKVFQSMGHYIVGIGFSNVLVVAIGLALLGLTTALLRVGLRREERAAP